MKTNFQTTTQYTSFGTLIPAKPLIKSALGNPTFQEAKILNRSLGIKYSGHIGFHKRALKIASEICTKDEKFNKIITELKKLPPEKQQTKIDNIVSELGENIDISI